MAFIPSPHGLLIGQRASEVTLYGTWGRSHDLAKWNNDALYIMRERVRYEMNCY